MFATSSSSKLFQALQSPGERTEPVRARRSNLRSLTSPKEAPLVWRKRSSTREAQQDAGTPIHPARLRAFALEGWL
jgi:hypothetical protein